MFCNDFDTRWPWVSARGGRQGTTNLSAYNADPRCRRRSMTSLEAARARFTSSQGLPFAEVLTEASILEVLDEHKVEYRDRLFGPVTTIWGFLSQVLSDDHSCRDAVSRVLAHRSASGLGACSPNTASYCNARSRLPTNVLRTLATRTAEELRASAPREWRWNGRRVF